MKKFINCFILASIMMSVALSFTSCAEEEDYGNKKVDEREYKSYIIGKWVLVSEQGYADFNADGLNEIFSADISGAYDWGNDEYKTCLHFKDFGHVDVIPYNIRCGYYDEKRANRCQYEINIYNKSNTETEGYLHIYGKGIDNTYTIELFKERWLKLKHVDQGQMVVFTFEYVY